MWRTAVAACRGAKRETGGRPRLRACNAPAPHTLHQPHPAAYRTARHAEDPRRLGLRKTFLDGLDDAPAQVLLAFCRQRAGILFVHAQHH